MGTMKVKSAKITGGGRSHICEGSFGSIGYGIAK